MGETKDWLVFGVVGVLFCHCTAEWPNSWTIHIAIAKIIMFISFSLILSVKRRLEKIRLTYRVDGVPLYIHERASGFAAGPTLNLTFTCFALVISVLKSTPNCSKASLAEGRLTRRSAISSDNFRSDQCVSFSSRS